MKMLTSVVICLVCAVVALPPLGGPQLALAAPLPPDLIANHDTEECASFFPGDECSHGVLPAGWASLGFEGEAECPAGYELVEMVISRRAKQCAFVEDAEECFLPTGWAKHPADGSGWECPAEYSWVDDPACMSEEQAAQAGRWALWLVVAVGLVAVGVLALCAVLVWLFLRRRR